MLKGEIQGGGSELGEKTGGVDRKQISPAWLQNSGFILQVIKKAYGKGQLTSSLEKSL